MVAGYLCEDVAGLMGIVGERWRVAVLGVPVAVAPDGISLTDQWGMQ